MGRRSINTTKSGKYMNPTDQARKEARKKELKKNKKQRQMVRAAVLKGKDPNQIIDELEKIDQMEYNVLQPSPLNEKVLKDKRKKLRDTLDRVLKMYHKDDPDKWIELKRYQAEYERRRGQLITFYESVKHAQQVSVDEIPLPAMQQGGPLGNMPLQIPLPAERGQLAVAAATAAAKSISILKKSASKLSAAYQTLEERAPPGVPPSPPPLLSSGSEDEDEESGSKAWKDQQNVDELMKEIEAVQKNSSRKAVYELMDSTVPPGTEQDVPSMANILFRTPVPPVGSLPNVRLPVPMPGRPPVLSLMPPRLGVRLPTGPPPPRLVRMPGNVLTAAPQLISRTGGEVPQSQQPPQQPGGATIMAKPQIRNLSADVTRFVPSALRIKRENKKDKDSIRSVAAAAAAGEIAQEAHAAAMANKPTRDDAYMQFMKEMEELL